MPLMFNMLLLEAGLSLSDVRLLRHKDGSAAKGRSPFELWRDDREAFERYQSVHDIGKRQFFGTANYWASFAGMDDGETLFLGLYSVLFRGLLEQDTPRPHAAGVDRAGQHHAYELTKTNLLNDCDGRLFIAWGEGKRSWIQRPDNQNKRIVEFRREFTDPAFPGYLEFIRPLSRIEGLPSGWKDALRSSRGIYLLTCPKTKEQYVGSASGEDGFLGRWLSYVQDGHGGNVGLIVREPSDYQLSILEVAGSSATVADILAMEVRWKLKLQSREMGLNRN